MMNLLCIKFSSSIELTSLLTTFLSVCVVIAGWVYNQRENRKNEIAKEARNYRLEMLNSFMNLFCLIVEKNNLVEPGPPNEYGQDNHYIPKMSQWASVYVQIKIYGKNDEIKLYEEIMSVVYDTLNPNEPCVTNKQFDELYEKSEKLSILCTNRIRNELGLDKISKSDE
ncbi:hypothetical protein AGMMS50239_11870 [Bacteroidia bacterium]|nr:hypothetical protein AGMMS50239_11870 [Bacteroidia bacterium]